MKIKREEIETDIVVIGGGGAGLVAANSAKKKGCKVLIISKSPVGSENATAFSGGGFSFAIEGVDEDEHFRRTIEAGKNLNNQKLVRILARNGPEKVLALRDIGIELMIEEGHAGIKVDIPPPGNKLSQALLNHAKNLNVDILSNNMALELVIKDGKFNSVLSYDFINGEIYVVKAKACIMATGGAGAIYPRTDNPPGLTGDGYVLGLRAGMSLQDMEFVQFYPMGTSEKDKPLFIIPPLFGDIGRIVNKKGEDVIKKYGITVKPVAIRARDMLSRAFAIEIVSGNAVDDCLLLDITNIKEADLEASILAKTMIGILRQHFSCDTKPIKISPISHFSQGGIVINEFCQTDIKGIFACGEATTGVHGANRMGGNALVEILVFGEIAGRSAAEYTQNSTSAKVDDNRIEELISKFNKNAEQWKKGSIPPLRLREKIGKIMEEKAGVLRSGSGLTGAISELRVMREKEFPRLRVTNFIELKEALEVENILTIAEIIAKSALEREESRGTHYRSDFPQQDDSKWLKNITIKNNS